MYIPFIHFIISYSSLILCPVFIYQPWWSVRSYLLKACCIGWFIWRDSLFLSLLKFYSLCCSLSSSYPPSGLSCSLTCITAKLPWSEMAHSLSPTALASFCAFKKHFSPMCLTLSCPSSYLTWLKPSSDSNLLSPSTKTDLSKMTPL